MHRYDEGNYYPMTGHLENVGEGDAAFKKINIGWNVNKFSQFGITAGTHEYIYVFNQVL
jgi:acetoin utilization deacetylase AcuC-like enzyme